MKFEKGKRTYVWPLSVTDVVVKRLVRHCHVPCCSHKYKYNYKYTHTHRYTNHEPDDQNSPKRTEEACKKLPRALLLSQIQIQVQIHTQTYTMMTNMVVKTKEACKTLLRAALTAHCKTLPHTDHCTQSQRLHTFPRSCRRHILERLCSQSRKLVTAVKEIKFCLSTGSASITNAARRVNSLCEHYT